MAVPFPSSLQVTTKLRLPSCHSEQTRSAPFAMLVLVSVSADVVAPIWSSTARFEVDVKKNSASNLFGDVTN
eukprot:3212648-Amphidinium_carterae.1